MRVLFFLLVTVLLTGCVGTESIFTRKLVLVEIPAGLLKECSFKASPMSPEEFRKLELDLKIRELHRTSTEVFAMALKECNSNINAIKDWQEDQKKVFNKEK